MQFIRHRSRAVLVVSVLAAVLVLATVQPGRAQTVPVRGGEHGDFTRLVMQLPDGTSWQVDQEAQTVRLRVDAPRVVFDLEQTFARIPRLRVASVRRAPGPGIEISLACDCPLRVFEDLPGQVVIDVLNPPDDATVAAPTTSPATSPASAAGRALAEALRASAGAAPVPTAQVPPGTETGWLALDRLALDADLPRTIEDPQREAMRADLGAAFSRAVEQGLLDPLVPVHDGTLGSVETGPVDAPPGAETNVSGTMPPARAHIRIAPDQDPQRSNACLPEAAMSLAEWGDGSGFATRMGAHRSALLSEFDRPDPEVISAKVRSYLHFGFGAEARSLMRAFPELLVNGDILRTLSHIVDGETPPYPGRLGQQAGCPTIGALWAVLAQPPGADIPSLDMAALRRGFAALPAHHRHHLGPILVDRMLALDDSETARVIRDSMVRAAGTRTDPAWELAETDASILLHEVPAADSPAITGALDPASSPRALALMLSQQLALGRAPDAELVDLAGIVAAEHRGTDMGTQIRALQVEALARHDRFAEAFDAVAALTRADAALGAQLRRDLFAWLAAAASDDVFVSSVFAERPWENTGLLPSTTLSLADRLVQLGFPSHARRMLDQAGAGLEPVANAILRARSHLVEAAPDAALDQLHGVPGAVAAALRDDALAMQDTLARNVLPAALELQASPTNATPGGSPQAPAVAQENGDEGGTSGLLRRGQDALSSATDLREGIAALLNEPLPELQP